eukprot:5244027-Amphidinium_carterae.1
MLSLMLAGCIVHVLEIVPTLLNPGAQEVLRFKSQCELGMRHNQCNMQPANCTKCNLVIHPMIHALVIALVQILGQ